MSKDDTVDIKELNPYDILGLEENATSEAVRTACKLDGLQLIKTVKRRSSTILINNRKRTSL